MQTIEEKRESFQNLSQEILNCRKCELWQTRTNPLVGDGDIHSKVVLIGEAPGFHEDLQKTAFIGQAGKVLDELLKSIRLLRKDIYITNLLKCHPPQNQSPTQMQTKACAGYLYRQLKFIQPKVILTLGKYASQELFKTVFLPFSKISEMHGKSFQIKASYGKVWIIALYHPSAACYRPEMLEILKKDFQTVQEILKS
jgi:uracil-DNA glycosylase family 4